MNIIDICSICLEQQDSSLKTPCGHYFHQNCISRILNPVCPICKTDIFNFLIDNNILIPQENITYQTADGILPKYKAFKEMIDFFFELCNDKGILCRRDFTCCNSCGAHEIEIEREETEGDEEIYTGYIFYHTQTTIYCGSD